MNATETPYGDVADVSDCGESECAQSYYEDLSFSLNHFDDVQLGCTSGIKVCIDLGGDFFFFFFFFFFN